MNDGSNKYKTMKCEPNRFGVLLDSIRSRKFRIYTAGISTITIQSKYFSFFVYDEERDTHISPSYMTHYMKNAIF